MTEHQDSPHAIALIGKKLEEIRPKRHEIGVRLASLQALTKQFLRLDVSVVARIKGKDFSKLSKTEQRLIRKIWKEEQAKIDIERNLGALEGEAPAEPQRCETIGSPGGSPSHGVRHSALFRDRTP